MTNINIDCRRVVAAAAAVLLAGRVVGIEAAAVAVGHPAKQVVVAGVAKPEVVAVMADTVRIAGDHHRKTAVEAVGIVPAAVLLQPNVVVVVPSFWRLTVPEKLVRA